MLALSGALLLSPGLATAQGLADDAGQTGPPPWAYAMAHDIMSPFCPGRTLAACPSPQADQLRQWILFQAAAGQSEEQVEEMLFERFGDVLLSAPKAEGGWGVSAYAIPAGGFLLGGGVVVFVIFRMARRGDGLGAESSAAALLRPAAQSSSGSASAAGAAVSDTELERMVDEEFARS
jgi:cytochrome c-type biogenesis protein CcmH/NrfF